MKRLACVAIWLAACGNSGPASYKEFLDQLRDKQCTLKVACGDYPDLATCKSSTPEDVKQRTLEADIDAGRIEYDRSAAEACLTAHDQLSCDLDVVVAGDALDVCDSVLVGHVAVDGNCFDDEQCADDGACAILTGCSLDNQCCPGRCVTGTSREIVPLGGDCKKSFRCVDGAYCKDVSGDGAFTCVARASSAGAACDIFDGCVLPLICNQDGPRAPGTCYQPAAHGAACDPTVPFAYLQSCALATDYCDSTTKVCTSRKKPGEACSAVDPSACLGYATCDATTNTCVAVPGAGEACSGVNACLGELTCTNDMCGAPPAPDVCQ